MKSIQNHLWFIANWAAIIVPLAMGSLFSQDYVNAQLPWHKAVLDSAAAGASNSGTYLCAAMNSSGALLSNQAALTVLGGVSTGRLSNLSCRSAVGAGASQLIAGFVLGGQGTAGGESVLVRASGPARRQVPACGGSGARGRHCARVGHSSIPLHGRAPREYFVPQKCVAMLPPLRGVPKQHGLQYLPIDRQLLSQTLKRT